MDIWKPLLLIGESLVHILQNDLTAQMVNRDVMNVDTIDDLFDDRLEFSTPIRGIDYPTLG
ncbi:unnamed protein product [Oppiella nova]|uniref:Uncharacterized protein n=1 Tax=Oppiella nova TaxID=334625 RepID=A0A7R9QWA8_9ACAR|nr:unnamed protein product [Oppiella nova]CAG2176693.1 unnamed protein product [Oppiella nova]